MTAIETLRRIGACHQAIGWASERQDQSPQRLWDECDRADWLAWYMGKLAARDGHGSPAHRRVVLVACLCARTASRFWRDPASEQAVALVERWAWGDETVTRAALADACAADAAYAVAVAAVYAVAVATTTNAAYAVAVAVAATTTNAAYAADAFTSTRSAHLASLAELIRAAVPEVPT